MREVWELDVPLVVCPLRWFFCLVDMGASILLLVFPPFLGGLVYLWLVGFHHHSLSVHSWKPLILWVFRNDGISGCFWSDFFFKDWNPQLFGSEILKELKSTWFFKIFKEDYYYSKANDPISGSFWAQTRNPTNDCNKKRNAIKSLGLNVTKSKQNYINKIDRNQYCSTPWLEPAINSQIIRLKFKTLTLALGFLILKILADNMAMKILNTFFLCLCLKDGLMCLNCLKSLQFKPHSQKLAIFFII
jgi:hypothetical protein